MESVDTSDLKSDEANNFVPVQVWPRAPLLLRNEKSFIAKLSLRTSKAYAKNCGLPQAVSAIVMLINSQTIAVKSGESAHYFSEMRSFLLPNFHFFLKFELIYYIIYFIFACWKIWLSTKYKICEFFVKKCKVKNWLILVMFTMFT